MSRQPPSDPKSSEIRALTERYLLGHLARTPIEATALGIHDYDAELPSFSPSAVGEGVRFHARSAADARALLDRAGLTAAQRAELSLCAARAEADVFDAVEMKSHQRSPRNYGSTLLWGVRALTHRSFAPVADRAASVVSRLRLADRLFAEGRANLRNPPRLWVEVAIREAEGGIDFLTSQVPPALPGLSPKAAGELTSALQAACASYRAFADHLARSVLPGAAGAWRIGSQAFARKMALEEMTDEPLDALLRRGERELARLTERFVETAAEAEPGVSPAEAAARLSKDHPSPDKLLDETRAMLGTLRTFLGERSIVTMPDAPDPAVEDSPSFLREWAFAAMDTPGALETNATEAYYFVTLPAPDWGPSEVEQHLSFFNRPSLWNTTVHEVYPGHYVQCLRVREADSLLRRATWCGSFGEGWAHYCEEMMLDEGWGDHLPKRDRARLRLSQIQDALLRVCRYLSAIRMHCDAWDVDDATKFFVRRGFLEELPSRREALRGTMDPTYLVYTLGKLQILELREQCRAAWGREYSLRRFHDELLAGGGCPIAVHRARMLGV